MTRGLHGEPAATTQFLDWSATPWVLRLNVVSFLFIVFHAITFFDAAPQAMVVHIGKHPRARLVWLLAGHYVAWAAGIGRRVLGAAGGVDDQATSGTVAVDALQRRRRAVRPADADLLFLFGVAFPLGWLTSPTHEHMLAVLGNPLAALALFALCVLSLFHWAHRFRHTLYDGLQIKHLNEVIATICYGGAIVGSAVAVYLLWQFR